MALRWESKAGRGDGREGTDMSKKDGSGPAFPIPGLFLGMTLRDWFAGQYLNGLAGNEASCGTNEEWAKEAYIVADAMLAERSKE